MSGIFEMALKEVPKGVSFKPEKEIKVAGLVTKMFKEVDRIDDGTHPYIESHSKEGVEAFREECEEFIRKYGKAYVVDVEQ
ncbi:hypothetical protein PDK27_12360 [Bacillus cereus group sp. TH230-1LC]|nr:hypothetical protein [Bacillus cereus group sp. TH230-1LC]